MALAIRVDQVSKRFRLNRARYNSLKERVIHLGRSPASDFWALVDINLDIATGETVGLIGHNGSGKSTLLKCMAGILQPSSGSIATVGRVAALLELGAGFHPDLTGRENVFLNASILGMSRRETARRFDEIVAFAELEDFIDNQVKYYSSGMYIRLGFAVAVNMDPEILLVDEVLAVGDEAFQRKCLDRVRILQRDGRTIVFVTHAADLVRQICDRAVVLERGHMIADATPGEAIRTFRDHLLHTGQEVPAGVDTTEPDDDSSPERRRNAQVQIHRVTVVYPGSPPRPFLYTGEPLTIRVDYEAYERISDVKFGIAVHDQEGRQVFGTNTDLMEQPVGPLEGRGSFAWSFGAVPLLDGSFNITLAIHSHDEGTVYDWREQRDQFQVVNPGRNIGLLQLQVGLVEHATRDAMQ